MNIKQHGFGMIEVIGALAIMGVVMVGLAGMADSYLNDAKSQVAANHAKQVLSCGKTWIKDNYATVTATATPAVTYNLPVSTLVTAGCLPSNFSAVNAYGQTLQIRALEPVPNQVQAILISTGGDVVNDFDLGTIAAAIGAEGGSVRSASSTTLTGAFGGYAIPLASYGVVPGAGHLGGAIWFDQSGAALSDFVYRGAVPGHPEANTMSTPLVMASTQTLNAACTTTGAIAQDGTGKVISCQGGLWKGMSNGGDCIYSADNLNFIQDGAHCYNGAGNPNSPAGGDWFFLEVYRHVNPGNYYTVQRLMGMTGAAVGKVWHRNQQSGSSGAGWSAWVQQADNKVSIWDQPGEGGVVTITANDGNAMHIETVNGGRIRLVNSPWNAELASFDQAGNLTLNQSGATNVGYINMGWAVETWGCSNNGSVAKSAYNVNDGWAWNGKPLHCEAGVWRSDVTANTILAAGTITPGWGVETWGCSPTGAISRAAYTIADGWAYNGKTLSCQYGVWKNSGSGREFKGLFTVSYTGGCQAANPLTGACSCPAGSSPIRAGTFYLNGFWSSQPDNLYACY